MYLGPVIRRFEGIQDASEKTIAQLATMSRLSTDFCLSMMQNAGLKQYKYTVPVPTENGMALLETWVILGATGLPSVISWVKIPPRQELGVKTTALFYYNKIDEASGEIKGYFLNYGGGTWTTSAAPATCEIPKTNDRADWIFWTGKGVNDVVVSRIIYDEDGCWDVFWGAGGVEIARIRDFSAYISAACLSSGALVFAADDGIYQVIDNEAVLVLEVELSSVVINQSGTIITAQPYSSGDAIHYSLSVTDGLASASQSGVTPSNETGGIIRERSGGDGEQLPGVETYEYTDLTVPECPNYHDSYTNLHSTYTPAYSPGEYTQRTVSTGSYDLTYCAYQKDEFVYSSYSGKSENVYSSLYTKSAEEVIDRTWIDPTDYIIWFACVDVFWGEGWYTSEWSGHTSVFTQAETVTDEESLSWKGFVVQSSSYSSKRRTSSTGTETPSSSRYVRCGSYLFPEWCLEEEVRSTHEGTGTSSFSRSETDIDIEGAIPAVDVFLKSKYSCSGTSSESYPECNLALESMGLYLNNTEIYSFGDEYVSFQNNSMPFNHYGNAVFLINAYPQFYLFGLADGNLTDIGSVVGGVSEDPTYGDLNIFDLIPISGGATNA